MAPLVFLLLIGLFASRVEGQSTAASLAGVRIVSVKGAKFIPLKEFITRYGLTKHTVNAKTWTLKSKWTQLTFTDQSRIVKYNGVTVYLTSPLQRLTGADRGDWGVSFKDYMKTFDPLLRPQSVLRGLKAKTVLIDPGHGGIKDGTVSAKGMKEKTAALDVSRRLAKRLTDAGYKVMMTRNSDKDVSLESRAAAATTSGADLFISIHFNAGPSSAAGIETFALSIAGTRSTHDNGGGPLDRNLYKGNRTDGANVVAGAAIHTAMIRRMGARDRGLKRARFLVLRDNTCPAVLIEGGFLSNPTEAAKINNAAYRDSIAIALFNGVQSYFGKVKLAR